MAKKKMKLSLWKLSLAVGVLLGIGIKLWDFFNVGYIRCGIFSPPQACNGFFQYIKELPIWIILGMIAAFVFIYGGRYLIIHVFHSAKDFKMPKAEFDGDEKKVKKEVKKEKKEEPESSQEKEEAKEERKVIKI